VLADTASSALKICIPVRNHFRSARLHREIGNALRTLAGAPLGSLVHLYRSAKGALMRSRLSCADAGLLQLEAEELCAPRFVSRSPSAARPIRRYACPLGAHYRLHGCSRLRFSLVAPASFAVETALAFPPARAASQALTPHVLAANGPGEAAEKCPLLD